MLFIKSLGLKVWAYIALAFALLAGLYKVYDAGGDAVKVRGLKKTLKVVKERDGNETVIDTLDSDSVNNRLRDNGWTRD